MTEGSSSHQSDGAGARRRTVGLITRIVIGVQLFLMCGGWIYRATVYWRIPVARGDAYGLGDIIELWVYFGLIGSSIITLTVAAALMCVPTLRHWRSIAALACVGLLAVPLFVFVHSHLPRVMRARSSRHAPAGAVSTMQS